MSEDDLSWRAPRIIKDPETKSALMQIVKRNILMEHLPQESLSAVVDALLRVQVNEGDVVVREGDFGDGSYIVEEGQLRCSMATLGHRCDYAPVNFTQGETFGEISLMYGNIRAATITAVKPSVLWKLDRETFKKIVLNAMMPRHAAFFEFVQKVQIFRNCYPDALTDDEKNRLVKCSQRLEYPKGAEIVREGDKSVERYLFLISSGRVSFLQKGKEVDSKGQSQFFGARWALFDDSPIATAVAKSNCQVYRVPETVVKSLPEQLLEEMKKVARVMYV